jgi:hypothetical protein
VRLIIDSELNVTPDVNRLRRSLDQLHETLERIEFEFVDDPRWAKPSDFSYLTDADRGDPDIMDNVDAMAATNELIAWFGQDFEGYVGLWRGPNGLSLDEAPVVRLDSEGQYYIVAVTVSDYLAISVDRVEEEAFEEIRRALIAAGFDVRGSREEIWAAIDGKRKSPNDYRLALYNQRRGLRAI